MEQVRDLNMEADDMQVVLSALKGVSKRIKEVAKTHKPLFGGEHFLTSKEVCERLYISPRTLQDYRGCVKMYTSSFLCTKPRLSQARALLFPKVFVPLGIQNYHYDKDTLSFLHTQENDSFSSKNR